MIKIAWFEVLLPETTFSQRSTEVYLSSSRHTNDRTRTRTATLRCWELTEGPSKHIDSNGKR